MLLERKRELGVIEHALSRAAHGSGGTLLVEGPAGIGKTALLAETCALAEAREFTVLKAVGRELERGFAFGLARQMFEPSVSALAPADREELLAGAVGLAPLFGPPVAEPSSADVALGVFHGLHRLMENLAAGGPLLLVADDAHWGDVASLEAFAYLAARLEAVPVLLAVAVRTGDRGADSVSSWLGAYAETIRPRLLSPEATSELVRMSLAGAAEDSLCAACHRATGGNPLFVHALARELGEANGEVSAEQVDRLVPRSVSHATLVRLRQLGADALGLAQALAILERAPVALASELAGLDLDSAAAAADTLIEAGVVARELPLRFEHPLLRSAVYEDLPPAGRDRSHRRAADLLARLAGDMQAAAAHLMLTEPAGEEWAAQVLGAAGREAMQRGAPEAARAVLQRAFAEGGDARDRASLLLQLGQSELACGDPTARAHLTAVIDQAPEVAMRAEAFATLCYAAWDAGDSAAPYEAAAETLRAIVESPDAQEVAAHLLSAIMFGSSARPDSWRAARELLAAAWLDNAAGPVQGVLMSWRAWDAMVTGEPAERVKEAAGLALSTIVDSAYVGSAAVAAYALIKTDHMDLARPVVEDMGKRARRRGSAFEHQNVLSLRIELFEHLGLIPQMLAEAEVLLELIANGWKRAWVLERRAGFLLERGEVAEALAAFEQTAEMAAARAGTTAEPTFYFGRSRVRLECGDYRGALEDALASGKSGQVAASPAHLAWRSRAALAAAHLGQTEQARELWQEELSLARRSEVNRVIGVALRTGGIVEGGPEGLDLLEESASVLASSPARLEQARALVEWGAALRRARHVRDARTPLRAGLDLARQCGASVLADRARDELHAAGARPRREAWSGVASLTPRELRIAELAADGLGNRDIAETLFLSLKTVEAHLRNIFMKLGISARAEIGGLLRERDTLPDQPVT